MWDRIFTFRPWMLALAVFLACAIGVALMERLRGPDDLFAQAQREAPAQRQ